MNQQKLAGFVITHNDGRPRTFLEPWESLGKASKTAVRIDLVFEYENRIQAGLEGPTETVSMQIVGGEGLSTEEGVHLQKEVMAALHEPCMLISKNPGWVGTHTLASIAVKAFDCHLKKGRVI